MTELSKTVMTDNRSTTTSQTEEPRFVSYSVGETRKLRNIGLMAWNISVSRVAWDKKPDLMSCQRRFASDENGDKPCFARYADCIHNGNLATPAVRVNSARNSQTVMFGIMSPRYLRVSG